MPSSTYGDWNYNTHRHDGVNVSSYDDTYRGVQNATYTTRPQVSNQGYASIKTNFPQASFVTCRYQDKHGKGRQTLTNNWHLFSSFPPLHTSTPGSSLSHTLSPFSAVTHEYMAHPQPLPKHLWTGTKPLPQAPGPIPPRARVELSHSQPISHARPSYDHGINAPIHEETKLRAGQVYRPSTVVAGSKPTLNASLNMY